MILVQRVVSDSWLLVDGEQSFEKIIFCGRKESPVCLRFKTILVGITIPILFHRRMRIIFLSPDYENIIGKVKISLNTFFPKR